LGWRLDEIRLIRTKFGLVGGLNNQNKKNKRKKRRQKGRRPLSSLGEHEDREEGGSTSLLPTTLAVIEQEGERK